MRYRLPSPYEELPHTADVGIRASGSTLNEVFARAALAMAQLQAGGGPVEPLIARPIEAHAEDRASLLVDFCRQVLARFFDERLLLGMIEVDSVGATTARAVGWFAQFDPALHVEGADLKAVTYARSAVEPLPGGGFEATLIFDI
jgi:SHS2 domain-containing protein